MPAQQGLPHQGPHLAELLSEDRFLDLKGRTKQEVLEELVAAVCDLPGQPGRRVVLQGILDREDLRPTGIGEGIAIPHCKDARIRGFGVAIGRTRQPIDFGSPDDQPVRVLAIISAQSDRQAEYLRLLSTVTRFLRRERDAIVQAEDMRRLHELTRSYGS